MALGSGEVSLIGWYRVDDFPHSDRRLPDDKVHNHLGLYGVNGKPKPAQAAFAFFNQLFNQPTRSAKVVVSSSAGSESQAMVHAIQKKNGELVVAAWLRSSEDPEVEDRSGVARDRRRETLRIALPCTETRGLRFYSPTGRPVSTSARVQLRNQLTSVPVDGRSVFVARLQCLTD